MSWRDGICALDLETTAPDPELARIVTCCFGIGSADGWDARTWLFRQGEPIPPEATAIHGITTEVANEHGDDPREALLEITDQLSVAWASGYPVAIYNAPYDLTVLERESRRHGLTFEVVGPVIDPLVCDKALDRFRRGSRKLIDVARHYGVTLDESDAHGAEADALATCRLAWKLAPKLPSDRAELASWQRDQYREQRLSFADYRRRRGEPLDDESTDWPLRPYVEAITA